MKWTRSKPTPQVVDPVLLLFCNVYMCIVYGEGDQIETYIASFWSCSDIILGCVYVYILLGGETDRNIHRKFLILFWYSSAVHICEFVARRVTRLKPTSQVFYTVRRAVVPEPSTNKTKSRPHPSHGNLLTPNFATNHNSPFPLSLTFDPLNQLSKILKTELGSKYDLNRKA